MYMNLRGLKAAITGLVLVSSLWGCAGDPLKEDPALSLLELPISFDDTDASADSERGMDNSTAVSDASASETGPQEALSGIPAQIPATVIARGVNIRQAPGTAGASLGRAPKGTALSVTEIREDGWCRVETRDGLSGYAWAPLLNIEDRKFKTARYKGMRHILVSANSYLGPDGIKRSKLEVEGLSFLRPLKQIRLTSRFGVRKKHPVNGGRNKMHQGVDLKASVGTSVRAAAGGIVKSIKRGPNYGVYVDIKHKLGFTTRYAHLSRTLVKKGQRVKAGQLIARSGNTGATTGPHLHFELHKRGKAVNPIRYITALR